MEKFYYSYDLFRDDTQILVDKYGWEELSHKINIRCFYDNPSIKSSLTFLRKTPWARKKIETLFLNSFGSIEKEN